MVLTRIVWETVLYAWCMQATTAQFLAKIRRRLHGVQRETFLRDCH
jgi:hypothetical protein